MQVASTVKAPAWGKRTGSAPGGGWEKWCTAGEHMCITNLFLNNLVEVVNFLWNCCYNMRILHAWMPGIWDFAVICLTVGLFVTLNYFVHELRMLCSACISVTNTGKSFIYLNYHVSYRLVSIWVMRYCLIPSFNAFRAPVILPKRQAFVPVFKYWYFSEILF